MDPSTSSVPVNENKILSDVADTILDKPISFDITVKRRRFWEKRKRSFQITGSSLGTMIKISKELLAIDLKVFDKDNILDSNYILIEQHAERMARIIAFAIVNSRAGPSKSLVKFLLNNLTSAELQKLLNIVLQKIDIGSFMTSIISVKSLNILAKRTASAENAGSTGVNP